MKKRKDFKTFHANYKVSRGTGEAGSVVRRGNENNNAIATDKWIKKDAADDTEFFSVDQVHPVFREPFIISAYRKCNTTAWYCFKSLFQATNETINIWSHLLALVVFLLRFASVFAKHDPFKDSRVYPLLCFAAGISVMLVMSAGAHTFNCMSIRARYVCFFLDYSAISVYTFTAGQVFFFYSRPVESEWMIFNNPVIFLGISAAISFASTLACCCSFGARNRFDPFVKAGTYSCSWLFNTSPYLTMLLLCGKSSTCSSASSIHYFTRHFFFYAGGVLAYVTRLPERLMVGAFDVVGHSHHFLHILCCIGVADEFSAMELDMAQRRPSLDGLPGPTFANTILLTTGVIFGNILVLLWSVAIFKLHKE